MNKTQAFDYRPPKRERRMSVARSRVLDAPSRRRRWSIVRPEQERFGSRSHQDAEAHSGSSVERLRQQLRWLVAQEVDYFFATDGPAVSGGYTPSYGYGGMSTRSISRPSLLEVLHEEHEPAQIIDFLAYKKERETRGAS